VDARYFMAGFNARVGMGEAPLFSPFLDVSIYGGAGPSSFYLLQPDGATHDDVSAAAFVLSGGLSAGVRLRVVPRGSRVRLDLWGQYHADAIYASLTRTAVETGPAKRTDFGGLDIFHGPSIAIRGAL